MNLHSDQINGGDVRKRGGLLKLACIFKKCDGHVWDFLLKKAIENWLYDIQRAHIRQTKPKVDGNSFGWPASRTIFILNETHSHLTNWHIYGGNRYSGLTNLSRIGCEIIDEWLLFISTTSCPMQYFDSKRAPCRWILKHFEKLPKSYEYALDTVSSFPHASTTKLSNFFYTLCKNRKMWLNLRCRAQFDDCSKPMWISFIWLRQVWLSSLWLKSTISFDKLKPFCKKRSILLRSKSSELKSVIGFKFDWTTFNCRHTPKINTKYNRFEKLLW